MDHHALAPVQWEIGQPLLPSHLTAQEDFLIADTSLRTHALSLPNYGLSQLEWDKKLLKKGCLSIKHFRLTIPASKRVVDYPDNTQLVSSQIELAETKQPVVYYFVLEKNIHKQAEAKLRPITNGDLNRRYFKLIVTPFKVFPEEFEYLLNDHIIHYQGCLGVFTQHSLGDWQVTDEFIPPLIHFGTSPYLLNALDSIKRQLQHYKETLHISFNSEPLPLKQYVKLSGCIKSVQESLFMLDNLINLDNKQGELKFHPYQVYRQLCQLCTELALYQGDWPEEDFLAYKHEEIHLIFKQLFARLKAYLSHDTPTGRSSQFVLDKNIYTASMPNKTNREDRLYFIIKLHELPPLNPYEIPQISSPSQLGHLYEYSLKGLALEEVSETKISYHFGQNVQCFYVQKNKEYELIQHESAAAFYDQASYQGYEFYLYSQR
jgi:predicted component of type VI protein secretion system